MRLRAPLYLKFWLWLALNLLLLTAVLLVVASRNGPGWRMLLTEPVRDRLATIGTDIGRVLSETPDEKWATTLAQLSELYGAQLAVARAPRDGPPRDGGPPRRLSDLDKKPPPREPGGAPPPPRLDRRMRADLITLRGGFVGPFQITIPASIERAGQPPMLYDIQAGVDDLVALLGFLGVENWVMYPLLALGLSALLWLPFVWNITRTISSITRTTERIAEGEFDARVVADRRDELGQLAESVNRMAGRLGSHLSAQRQFLADVAHEIASPLARLRVALGLLGTAPAGKLSEQTLSDMHDDLQQMADMLNDLLLFSRADIGAPKGTLIPVAVHGAAVAAIEREGGARRVVTRIEPTLYALADAPMLKRALANLVRNALRYGGPDGSVEMVAGEQGERIVILVRDRGPGVREDLLPRLGEPFFRIEASRSRESGGFGLGLAIVKRCSEACGGEVVFRNREGGGFEAELRLRRARQRA